MGFLILSSLIGSGQVKLLLLLVGRYNLVERERGRERDGERRGRARERGEWGKGGGVNETFMKWLVVR